MAVNVKKIAKRKVFNHPFFFVVIKINMKTSQENGKFKIICIKVPKWLAFILRKFAKEKK